MNLMIDTSGVFQQDPNFLSNTNTHQWTIRRFIWRLIQKHVTEIKIKSRLAGFYSIKTTGQW